MIYGKVGTALAVNVGPVLDTAGAPYVTDDLAYTDFLLSKNGTYAAPNASATVAHQGQGHFKVTLAAADISAVGAAELILNKATLAAAPKDIVVMTAQVYDSMVAGTDVLKANNSDGAKIVAAGATATALAVVDANVDKLLPAVPPVYVLKTGNDGNDGFSKDNAKLTITAGVGVVADGGTIHIGAGTFAESVVLSAKTGVKLIGSGRATLIQADSARVVDMGAYCQLHHLRIDNNHAMATGYYAVRANEKSFLIDHCRLTSNGTGLFRQCTDATDGVSCISNSSIRGAEYGFYCQVTPGLVRVVACDISVSGWTTCHTNAIGCNSGGLSVQDSDLFASTACDNASYAASAIAGYGDNARVSVHNTKLRAEAADVAAGVSAVWSRYGSYILIGDGCQITTSRTDDGEELGDDIHLKNDAASTLVVNNCSYDTAKTSGTIIDKTQTIYGKLPTGDIADQTTSETIAGVVGHTDYGNAKLARTGATAAAIAALAGSEITLVNPVTSTGEIVIFAGDDYLVAHSRQLKWTIPDYTGPAVSGAGIKVWLKAQKRSVFKAGTAFEDGDGTEELAVEGSATQDGTTVTATVELTAAQTGALSTEPPDDKYNYDYTLSIEDGDGHVLTQETGSMRVRRGL